MNKVCSCYSLGYFSAALPRQGRRKSRKWRGKKLVGLDDGKTAKKYETGEKELLSGTQNKTKAKTYFFISHFPGKKAEVFFLAFMEEKEVRHFFLKKSPFESQFLSIFSTWPGGFHPLAKHGVESVGS